MSALELKVYEIFKDTFLTKQDKVELVEKIESSKTDIVKWMFAFWIGTIGIAIVFYFLKK